MARGGRWGVRVLDAIAALEGAEAAPAAPPVDILAALDALDAAARRPVPAPVPEPDCEPRRESLRAFVARVAHPDRMAWPESWLRQTDSLDGWRCRTLWQDVLRVSLIDACDEVLKAFRKRRPQRPVSWVGTADFHKVCALAGFDGEAVAERTRRALATAAGAQAMCDALSPKGKAGER
jgi:hypothetical protein